MKTRLPFTLAAIAAAVSFSTAIAQTTPSTTDPNATPPGTGTKAVEGDTRKPSSTKDKYSKEQKDNTGKPTATTPGTATPPGAAGRGIEGDTKPKNGNKDQTSTMGTDRGGGAPSGGTAGAGTSNPRTPDNPATKTVPSGGSK